MQPNVESTTSKLSSSNGELLGVALDRVDRDACFGREAPAGVEELRRQVEADHGCARLRRAERRVPGAAGDVEDVLAGRDSDGSDDPRPDLPQLPLGDRRIVACGPGGACALLEPSELGQCCCVHSRPPR